MMRMPVHMYMMQDQIRSAGAHRWLHGAPTCQLSDYIHIMAARQTKCFRHGNNMSVYFDLGGIALMEFPCHTNSSYPILIAFSDPSNR